MGWLEHFLGFSSGDGNGSHYLFWSGIAGIAERLVELAVIGMILLRHSNCHVRHCWRIGRQQVEGTTFVVCRRHHPEGKPTAEQIGKAWRERMHLYVGEKPGRG